MLRVAERIKVSLVVYYSGQKDRSDLPGRQTPLGTGAAIGFLSIVDQNSSAPGATVDRCSLIGRILRDCIRRFPFTGNRMQGLDAVSCVRVR